MKSWDEGLIIRADVDGSIFGFDEGLMMLIYSLNAG